MTSIALFGAGGKMGYRLAKNLKGSRFDVRHVEVSDAGKARLQSDLGLSCVDADTALAGANVVILAVPDTAIGKVAASIVDKLAAGTMVVALDAAAPLLVTCRFAQTSPISSPIPAIRPSSTTRRICRPRRTTLAACSPSSTLSLP